MSAKKMGLYLFLVKSEGNKKYTWIFFKIYMLVLTGKKKSEFCYAKQEDGLKSKEGMPGTVKAQDRL